MASAIIECLTILSNRGEEYNGSSLGVKDYVYYKGDESAFHQMYRAMLRLKEANVRYGENAPDEAVKDKIIDCINYGLLWLMCRSSEDINPHHREDYSHARELENEQSG